MLLNLTAHGWAAVYQMEHSLTPSFVSLQNKAVARRFSGEQPFLEHLSKAARC